MNLELVISEISVFPTRNNVRVGKCFPCRPSQIFHRPDSRCFQRMSLCIFQLSSLHLVGSQMSLAGCRASIIRRNFSSSAQTLLILRDLISSMSKTILTPKKIYGKFPTKQFVSLQAHPGPPVATVLQSVLLGSAFYAMLKLVLVLSFGQEEQLGLICLEICFVVSFQMFLERH